GESHRRSRARQALRSQRRQRLAINVVRGDGAPAVSASEGSASRPRPRPTPRASLGREQRGSSRQASSGRPTCIGTQATVMDRDRFGNPHAPSLAYARGRILGSTEDDYRKLRRAWSLIRGHGPESVFVFTGLEHGLAMTPEEVRWADDELAPAVYADRLK